MTTKEFIQYANERPELCEKMAKCTNPEDLYAIASAEGVSDSYEIFIDGMLKAKNALELSDEDLDNVSAAGNTGELIVAAVTGIATSLGTVLMFAAI